VTPLRAFELVVPGTPEPGGSKRHVGNGRIVDANPKVNQWRQLVGYHALHQRNNRPLLEGPLQLTVRFYLARPKNHYGTGRNIAKIRPSAPAYPTTRPDTTKLIRAVEDAMTGVLYHDDAQIVRQSAIRLYGDPPRVEIQVQTIPFAHTETR
jgi:crossover junction endodeoxyribonuclease RusA